jgi:hypothetical protein
VSNDYKVSRYKTPTQPDMLEVIGPSGAIRVTIHEAVAACDRKYGERKPWFYTGSPHGAELMAALGD